MYIITNTKENAFWLTETPFDHTSGVWCFYDTKEEFEYDLKLAKKKYGSKLVLTLNKIEKLLK